MPLTKPNMSNCVRNLRISFALFTVGLGFLVAATGLNQRMSLSSYRLVRQGFFRVNGTTSVGHAVTASVGQCADFCRRHGNGCQGFFMRYSSDSILDKSVSNCQLVTLARVVESFPSLNSSVNDYQFFYVDDSSATASTSFVTKFLIETLAWGADDYPNGGSNGIGYIKLNGNVWQVTRQADRGFNIIELDVNQCTAANSRRFDTDSSATSSAELAAYVQNLHPPTVLVGVTVDDAANSLYTTAKNALIGIGVNVNALSFRGKASFIAQIGRPSVSVMKIAGGGGGNVKMETVVSTIPGTTDVSIVLVN